MSKYAEFTKQGHLDIGTFGHVVGHENGINA